MNECYAHTEFAVDGLMQNSKQQNISIFVQKQEIIPLKMQSVKVLEKENDNLVVRPLAQSNITNSEDSLGITEGGKYLAIKLDVNDKIKYEDLSDVKVYFNDSEIENVEVKRTETNDNFCLIFRIPTYTESSIFGWKSLREIYGNYFNIDESQVGKRINHPHEISIKSKYEDKERNITIKIDTIDDYITNINYKYNGEINKNDGVLNLDKWLEE